MKHKAHLERLTTLVTLREQSVDRLAAEMAAKARERDRYLGNLDRLAGLCQAQSSPGAGPQALAANHGLYKQALLEMADAHRRDCTLHEADMAVTQRALEAAARKHEVMGQVLARQQRLVRGLQQRRERKREDEIAVGAWGRAAP